MMKKLFNYFNCALCIVMLLAGMSVISCDKEQPNNGEDTEQVGGENNGGSSGDNTGSGSEGGNESGGGTGEEPGGNTDEELPDAITNSFAGVTLTLSLRNLTEVGVEFYGKAVLADSYSAEAFGIMFSTNEQITDSSAINLLIVDIYGTDYSLSTSSLKPNTTYYYTSYIKQGSSYKYGEVKSFTTKSLVAPTLSEASEIAEGSATISGAVVLPAGTSSDLEFGFQYSTSESFSSAVTTKQISEVDSENKFSSAISSLVPETNYYYRSYIKMNGSYKYGEVKSFTTLKHPYDIQTDLNLSSAVDLSSSASANSYIVSQSGLYKFRTVKGNSSTLVGAVTSASILWESFGTSTEPEMLDLVRAFCYKDGYIAFQTADTFKEGNAVIAAKDASGEILWSWHIWLTDEPQGQVYYNNAGTMMDRNLGATSATPGDVGALGLFYQWGRKDPFLGSSSISLYVLAKSTITWPAVVSSTSSTGTIAYATKNPTTFIGNNSSNYDWYYTGSSSTDDTRWTTSDKTKSIYDPCPPGWRVPDGGSNGVWSKSLGLSSTFDYTDNTYSSSNKGMNFSGKFGSASTIWYPASGYRENRLGRLGSVGYSGFYWSASPSSNDAYDLSFHSTGKVYPSIGSDRADCRSVRCIQEGSWGPSESLNVVDLSSSESANSYIISEAGAYKIKAVQGNSETSVGTVASAEVLWETFGTDVMPSVGDLIKNVSYSDGHISFQTAATFKEGNAVIAAKDASGNILWSWHIWMTDEPQGQEYYNNAGTMMDRNLGATSATPGDVGALGLLYQWGRKDPFLGSSSISSEVLAKSTITWPSAVSSTSSTGTIAYTTKNPTTFISSSTSTNIDWHYSSRDNTLWTTSDKAKSIYDPCPPGWRVPDGGSNGVWSKAVGSFSSFNYTNNFASYRGINFSGKFGSASTIWYPASSFRSYQDGSLIDVGFFGLYWSASPLNNYAYYLYSDVSGLVDSSSTRTRATGQSVRCLQVID